MQSSVVFSKKSVNFEHFVNGRWTHFKPHIFFLKKIQIVEERKACESISRSCAAISLSFIAIVTPWAIQKVITSCTETMVRQGKNHKGYLWLEKHLKGPSYLYQYIPRPSLFQVWAKQIMTKKNRIRIPSRDTCVGQEVGRFFTNKGFFFGTIISNYSSPWI